jgi:hypothetical protein
MAANTLALKEIQTSTLMLLCHFDGKNWFQD